MRKNRPARLTCKMCITNFVTKERHSRWVIRTMGLVRLDYPRDTHLNIEWLVSKDVYNRKTRDPIETEYNTVFSTVNYSQTHASVAIMDHHISINVLSGYFINAAAAHNMSSSRYSKRLFKIACLPYDVSART